MLDDAGYVCGLSGKLHISACHPSVCRAMERRIDDGYSVFHWSHGGHDGWPTHEYFQWLREKGIKFSTPHVEGTKNVRYGMPEELHQTTWCVDKAVNFMEANHEYGMPWMFSVNFFDPHHPFDPPKEYLERYMEILDKIPLPDYTEGELQDKPIFQQQDHIGAYNSDDPDFAYDKMSDYEHRLVRAAYWAMVDLVDKQIGRLLDALVKTGQMENTLIVFTSDHGEMLGDHGIYLKGPYFYEPAVHVPLIIAWPGAIEGGRRSKALVELTDIAQTLLDAAGIEHHPGMQGKSLWPLLKQEVPADFHRQDVYSEYYNAMPWHKDPKANATMVFDGRYKIVRAHGADQGELYDLELDPSETKNRWEDPNYQDIKTKMLIKLCDRMAWTVDPLPERQSAW
jgi:arylsulfatase A-like enzyme